MEGNEELANNFEVDESESEIDPSPDVLLGYLRRSSAPSQRRKRDDPDPAYNIILFNRQRTPMSASQGHERELSVLRDR